MSKFEFSAANAARETTMSNIEFLTELETIIEERSKASPEESYTAQLRQKGIPFIAQKVGEEAVETIIEALQGNRERLTSESADLVYHLLVLLNNSDLSLGDVAAELKRRHS
ncbi:phosphoribosyl-ATP diphosphatase [Gammaproteobacteria bacterium]|jgi:phosphoribosyl-ATP pyrophosphohydrolase|nr:phosphoribosyl-ATP diphosphatase [Gammaproteobacteria bacterium]